MEREQTIDNQYSTAFMGQIKRLKKRFFLIWGGVFAANLVYVGLAYFMEPPFGVHQDMIKVFPWFAGAGAIFTFFLFNKTMRREVIEERLQLFISEGMIGKIMKIEDLQEISELSRDEQQTLFRLNVLYPSLALCWGVNEMIGFLGVLNSLVAGGGFDISIFYFLLAISLNIAMYPPVYQFIDDKKVPS